MLKLIYKDLRAFQSVIIFQFAIVMSMMTFSFFFDQNGNMTFIILIMYPMILPMTLVLMDEKYQTAFNALPISRYNYVLAKYLGGLFFSFTIIGVALLYGYIMTNLVLTNNVVMNPLFSIKGLALIAMPIILINSITLPIFFAFSKKSGSIVLMILFIVILFALLLTLVYLEKNLPSIEYYSQKEVFPVMMYQLTKYIERIGKKTFLIGLVVGNACIFITSLLLALFVFRYKDIGGAK